MIETALCFYKALKVYPQPRDLISIYDKTMSKVSRVEMWLLSSIWGGRLAHFSSFATAGARCSGRDDCVRQDHRRWTVWLLGRRGCQHRVIFLHLVSSRDFFFGMCQSYSSLSAGSAAVAFGPRRFLYSHLLFAYTCIDHDDRQFSSCLHCVRFIGRVRCCYSRWLSWGSLTYYWVESAELSLLHSCIKCSFQHTT